jgi:hypothetical protein
MSEMGGGKLPLWVHHRKEGTLISGGKRGVGRMRALIAALAIAGAASAASAGTPGVANGQSDAVPIAAPTPQVPDGARAQAEAAIKRDIGDPDSTTFRAVRAMEAKSVRHGPFARSIDGPVSVVCGQYKFRDRAVGNSDYYWFFVAIKRGHVLWTAFDMASSGFDEAYESCEGAGLTHQTLTELGGARN